MFSYLNGQYLPNSEAKISPLDRGFLFGDGVYEVIHVYKGYIIHLHEHVDRLNASLQGIRMEPIHKLSEWEKILQNLIDKNGGGDQWIYLQVTRGFEPVRSHAFPEQVIPTVFAISYPKNRNSKQEQSSGIKACRINDIRWELCNIKTIARLAYVLMLQEAKDKGNDEGIIIHKGFAEEGTSSNLFLIKNNVIITPPKSNRILSGITRDKILQLAKKHHIAYEEKNIPEQTLFEADELWISSASRGVIPIVELEGKPVGNGKAGPLWSKMWDLYQDSMETYINQDSRDKTQVTRNT